MSAIDRVLGWMEQESNAPDMPARNCFCRTCDHVGQITEYAVTDVHGNHFVLINGETAIRNRTRAEVFAARLNSRGTVVARVVSRTVTDWTPVDES